MRTAFTFLITVQFMIILLHDLVEIPGWAHTSQMRAVLGRGKLFGATLANSIFPGLAAVWAWWFWSRPTPHYVTRYWMVYCAVTVLSAIGMWYVPYFLDTTEEKKEEFRRFYAGTRQILPERGDHPRPNLLHVLFHVLFVATFTLAILIAVTPRG